MDKEYIEREAALRAILGQPPDAHYPGWYADLIKEIPAADVAPVVHGEWVLEDHDEYGKQYECSVCGRSIVTRGNVTPSYCHCGAKMDGGKK